MEPSEIDNIWIYVNKSDGAASNAVPNIYFRELQIFHYIKIPHCSLIIIFNCLLIFTLKKFKTLKITRRHYFTLNLSVADVSTGFEGILHSVTFFTFLKSGHPLEHLETFLLKCTVNASVCTFLVIAIVECNAVKDPFNNNLTKFKCLSLIGMIWSISAILSCTSTYLKATDSRTYLHVKEFELTFYLSASIVICFIYVYIFSIIQSRKRKFTFYDPSTPKSSYAITTTIWATNSHTTTTTTVEADLISRSMDVDLSRSVDADLLSRSSSISIATTNATQTINQQRPFIIRSSDISLEKLPKRDKTVARLRISNGQHFYNTTKAAATAAVITFTFLVCFIPYIAFYARNLQEFVNENYDMQIRKSYVNGILFTTRSLLNPFILMFRSPEIRRNVISNVLLIKRKLTNR